MTFHFKPSAFNDSQICAFGNALAECPSSRMPQSAAIDYGPGDYSASNKIEKLFSNICAANEAVKSAESVATEERCTAIRTMPKLGGLRQIARALGHDAHVVDRGAR